MAEPIPVGNQYGAANWTDQSNNWRKADADWLQGRSILRFADASQRDSVLTAPAPGQVVFNAALASVPADGLEIRVGTQWIPYRGLPQNLSKVTDSATQVVLAHKDAAGQGVAFNSTGGVGVNTDLTVRTNVFKVETSGISVKTGTTTAKFTTDATHLLVDKPLSIPEIKLTGSAVPVLDATGKQINVGTLIVGTSITVPAITLSGTLSGGVINGTSGNIGTVYLTGGAAYADSGHISQAGMFHGDGGSAIMRYRNPGTGALSGTYVQTTSADIVLAGGSTYLYSQFRLMGGRGIAWHNSAGTHVAWGGVVIYSPGADPGAGNYPDGTIWFG